MIKHTNSRVGINNIGNNNIKQQQVLGEKHWIMSESRKGTSVSDIHYV